jgi:hypothetical protein
MPLPLPATYGRSHDFVRPTTSRKAVAGLVLGLLSFLFGVFASVPAFIWAARGLAEIDRDRAHLKGRGLALAGIFAAGLGLFLQPMLLLLGVQVARDRVMRATDAANLRRIGEAMYAYNKDHNHLPPAASKDANSQPLLSWRVALLPYLGEKELYEQFRRDEPWDSPHNFALIGRMPQVYAHPADPAGSAQGLTYYRVFVGGDAPFSEENGPRFPGRFFNGTSNTFLVVAAAEAVPWTKPDELPYDSNQPVPKLGGLLRGGYNALYADSTVRFVCEDLNQRKLRESIGEVFWGAEW